MILPAERNGIVGIRPTKGLVSPELVLTSRHFGTPGVLARTVKDAAIVLSTIADDDTEDGKHKFAIACDAGALQGMRIGVPTGYLNLCLNHDTKPLDQSIKERFARALGTMKNQGATIFEDVELIGLTFEDEIKEARSLARLIRICDYREEVEDFIKACGVQPEVGEFPELVNITRNDFVEEHTTRGAEWLKLAESGPRLRNQLKYEGNVQKVQHLGTEGGAAGALERYGLDAIVMPSSEYPKLIVRPRLTHWQ